MLDRTSDNSRWMGDGVSQAGATADSRVAPLIAGIDVGGTFTNAVLLEESEPGRVSVLSSARCPTDHEHLLDSVLGALDELLSSRVPAARVARVILSTTLSTNAIVEGKHDPVGLLAMPGPGRNWEEFGFGQKLAALSAAVDHRGREITPVRPEEVERAFGRLWQTGARVFAVCGKFSVRNPEPERAVAAQLARKLAGQAGEWAGVPVTMGHQLSGVLNFPRRLNTAYWNAAILRRQRQFNQAVRQALQVRGIQAPVYIVKADGGTMALDDAAARPVEAILSGPAASIMGAQALAGGADSPLGGLAGAVAVLDIGGTTTDVGVLLEQKPLFARYGAEIGGRGTVVRALFTRSFGLGGDSVVRVEAAGAGPQAGGVPVVSSAPGQAAAPRLRIGPERMGPAACLGGPAPTPTDAMVVLGLLKAGDPQLAERALHPIAAALGCTPAGAAEEILSQVVGGICQAVRSTYRQVMERPLYTIAQVLAGPPPPIAGIVGIGGPAAVLVPRVGARMGVPAIVPPLAAAANALGAAISQPTAVATVHVDTENGFYTVAESGQREQLPPGGRFTLERAREVACQWALRRARALEPQGLAPPTREAEVVEEQSFSVVRGSYTVGQVMLVRAQTRPRPYVVSKEGLE